MTENVALDVLLFEADLTQRDEARAVLIKLIESQGKGAGELVEGPFVELISKLRKLAQAYANIGSAGSGKYTFAADEVEAALDASKALAARPVPERCLGKWVSGSGGHMVFDGQCDKPANWRDHEAGHAFCDAHVLNVASPGIAARPVPNDCCESLDSYMHVLRAPLPGSVAVAREGVDWGPLERLLPEVGMTRLVICGVEYVRVDDLRAAIEAAKGAK